MILDWTNIPEQAMPNFKGGEGVTYARMFFDGKNRIMLGRLPAGSTIGMHTHETNSEIMHVLSGTARVVMDGEVEIIHAGQTHYCPKGMGHSLINDSDADLEFLAIIPEQ